MQRLLSSEVELAIDQAWREKSTSRGWDVSGLNLTNFRTVLPGSHDTSGDAHGTLGPWFPLFELGLLWLTSTNIALGSGKDVVIPEQRNLQPAWALIGTAASYGTAIRNLVLIGLDSPARSLLRTFTETLFLCMAVLDDPDLAEQYRGAESDEAVKNFWHSVATPRNLHRRVIEIERKMGLDEPTIKEFAEWHKTEHSIFSQAVHPSFVGSVLTVLSAAKDVNTHHFGVLGGVGVDCDRVVRFAALTTWYFSILGGMYLFDSLPTRAAMFTPKEDNPLHQANLIAREVLIEVTMVVWRNEDDV
jgi:hypothetical protein